MTDPETTAQDPRDASAPADPQVPTQEPGTDKAPSAGAPRRWRQWLVAALAVVMAAGLAAGLEVSARWIPPPVLRPTGLKAGPATANSVTFHWSQPATGPLPDKYMISGFGTPGGSAPGTATSYRQTGLFPGFPYRFRLVAVRGGKRSPASAPLTLHTLTPPLSQARLQEGWTVHVRNLHGSYTGLSNGGQIWIFQPVCATGACNETLDGQLGSRPFTMKLTRTGAVYQGQAVDNAVLCGTGPSAVPDPVTLKIRLHITAAIGEKQVWAAMSWAGTMSGTTQYVSAATYYCPAGAFTATIAALP